MQNPCLYHNEVHYQRSEKTSEEIPLFFQINELIPILFKQSTPRHKSFLSNSNEHKLNSIQAIYTLHGDAFNF